MPDDPDGRGGVGGCVRRGLLRLELVAELLGDDDRSLAFEEITVPGRTSDDSDAPGGAEGRGIGFNLRHITPNPSINMADMIHHSTMKFFY